MFSLEMIIGVALLLLFTLSTKAVNVALELPIVFSSISSSQNATAHFMLLHQEIGKWQQKVSKFAATYNVDENEMRKAVQDRLARLAYGNDILHNREEASQSSGGIPSFEASYALYTQSAASMLEQNDRPETSKTLWGSKKQNVVFFNRDNTRTNPVDDLKFVQEWFTIKSGNSCQFYSSNSSSCLSSVFPAGRWNVSLGKVFVFQNKYAFTGGTTALNILAEFLKSLRFQVTVCTELSSPETCNPTASDIVVTGEWCNGVMRDYGIHPENDDVDSSHFINTPAQLKKFRGRGVQYHLGFHHLPDTCRGFVTVADSHYLSVLLEHRILGGYFLGCPMADPFLDMLAGFTQEETSNKAYVLKENLLVIDPDFFEEYAPEEQVQVAVPQGIAVVYAKNIPAKQMPTLLQRAKAVLDLGMPGPERLSGEGILSGAIPIVSNRWNGASEIDFPVAMKVDHTNATAISEAIRNVMSGYQSHLVDNAVARSHGPFYGYVLSMWKRLMFTADVYFGSANLHFVLAARSRRQEYLCLLQILGVFYFFPLATVTLFVEDVKWFWRNQYLLLSIFREAGYIRLDLFDPSEAAQAGRQEESFSYFRIRSASALRRVVPEESPASARFDEFFDLCSKFLEVPKNEVTSSSRHVECLFRSENTQFIHESEVLSDPRWDNSASTTTILVPNHLLPEDISIWVQRLLVDLEPNEARFADLYLANSSMGCFVAIGPRVPQRFGERILSSVLLNRWTFPLEAYYLKMKSGASASSVMHSVNNNHGETEEKNVMSALVNFVEWRHGVVSVCSLLLRPPSIHQEKKGREGGVFPITGLLDSIPWKRAASLIAQTTSGRSLCDPN